MEQKKFSRYQDAPEDCSIRMQKDELDAKVSNLCIGELMGRLEVFTDPEKSEREMYPWADRFVMGYPLPSWQRPLVWTQEQKVKFIESIWNGVDIGSYMINDQWEMIKKETEYREFSEVLLDGQQRLSAIQDYLYGEFGVADANGVIRFWNELPKVERRRFSNFHFARASVKNWNEKELRRVYDLRAFGGTAHTEDQRASMHDLLHAKTALTQCDMWDVDFVEYAVFSDKTLAEQCGAIEDQCNMNWENEDQPPAMFYLVKLSAPLI